MICTYFMYRMNYLNRLNNLTEFVITHTLKA
jgi:hypothetical protein